MLKPAIDLHQIAELLTAHFGEPVHELAPVGTGQIASAYYFRVGHDEYIVRFVTGIMATSFAKDTFAHRRLSPLGVPVPPIIHTGTTNSLHFAISRKVTGVPLDELSDVEFRQAIPDLMRTLDAIHRADVSDTKGYGYLDENGVGQFDSWRGFLLSVADEEGEDGFYGKWHRMFDDTFIERELFDHVYERMTALLEFCPEDRHLVHADYGFGNVLALDGKITAVLDWALAMYGDFLYDAAWLDIGCPGFELASRFRRFYESQGRPIPHYGERILCYQCFISLDAQKWYGKTAKYDDYVWMRSRILSLLGEGEHPQ